MSWDWHSPMTKWEVACNSVYICSENCGFSPLYQINRKGNNILRGQMHSGSFVITKLQKEAFLILFEKKIKDVFKTLTLMIIPILISTFWF